MHERGGVSRRDLLKAAAAGTVLAAVGTTGLERRFGILIPPGGAVPVNAAAAQTPLAGGSIPRFVDPLPLLSVAGGPIETVVAGTSEITLSMREFRAKVMPSTFVPADGQPYQGTWTWGYRLGRSAPVQPTGTYLGPVIVATRDVPTQIRFVNDLGHTAGSNLLAWLNATDQTLHWADPLNDGENMCAHGMDMDYCSQHYSGPIPAVPHLHGGEVPPQLDGGPEAWFTSDGAHHGHAYYTKPGAAANEVIYRYPNSQEAGPMWFHDHVLGLTRLNVYAGLAGGYPIIDPQLRLPTGLHPVGLQQGSSGAIDYLIPLIIQDRMFDVNGQLYYPNTGVTDEHPFWIPAFAGDTIAVNGKVWPYLSVQPKRYRFLFINGSNSRAYQMYLINQSTGANGPPIWQIGTDGGYLDAPIKIDPNATSGGGGGGRRGGGGMGGGCCRGADGGPLQKLVLMPGERADVIIDFASFRGQTLVLRNTAPAHFPMGPSPDSSTVGQIIQFRVASGTVTDRSYNPASGTPLRPPMVRLVNPSAGTLAAGVMAHKTRLLTLNDVGGMMGGGGMGGGGMGGGGMGGGGMGGGGMMASTELLCNNTKWDGKSSATDIFPGGIRPDFVPHGHDEDCIDYLSEMPMEGEPEVWEIVNLTMCAHPIRTHLTQFQLINRQGFSGQYMMAYNTAFPGGSFIGGYGPPLDYNTGNPRALGGNPAASRAALPHRRRTKPAGRTP
jgi:FtsP/CotA-like multicopper oxidase with cupredoxin domain